MAAAWLTLSLCLVVGLGATAASARPHQDPGASTTLPTETTGAGTEPAGEVTTVPADTDEAPDDGVGSRRVADENRKIWLVVGGLVGVAILITLLTVRYWRQTKPVPVEDRDGADAADAAGDVPDDVTVATTPGRRSRRNDVADTTPAPHSRRAVAGADHVEVDEEWEPRGTGEHDRVVIPARERASRPTRDQRAAAYGAAERTD